MHFFNIFSLFLYPESLYLITEETKKHERSFFHLSYRKKHSSTFEEVQEHLREGTGAPLRWY